MGPTAEYGRIGDVHNHNGWLMFRWRVTGASPSWEGSTDGVDIVQIDGSDRMILNIVFPGA
jgi:hypothetical protein